MGARPFVMEVSTPFSFLTSHIQFHSFFHSFRLYTHCFFLCTGKGPLGHPKIFINLVSKLVAITTPINIQSQRSTLLHCRINRVPELAGKATSYCLEHTRF